jgi:hypothetical protein
MRVTTIPIREVDGLPPTKSFFVDNSSLEVYSHSDLTLVTLRFLNRTITVEASRFQTAILHAVSNDPRAKAATVAG